MARLLPALLFLLALTFLAAGCSSGNKKAKSSARIYEGDSPTIRMTERQAPGGELKPYR
jgi:hypothetical protein